MKTKQNMISKKVKEAIFFKEDFAKLPKCTIIYIKEGKITIPCPKQKKKS